MPVELVRGWTLPTGSSYNPSSLAWCDSYVFGS